MPKGRVSPANSLDDFIFTQPKVKCLSKDVSSQVSQRPKRANKNAAVNACKKTRRDEENSAIPGCSKYSTNALNDFMDDTTNIFRESQIMEIERKFQIDVNKENRNENKEIKTENGTDEWSHYFKDSNNIDNGELIIKSETSSTKSSGFEDDAKFFNELEKQMGDESDSQFLWPTTLSKPLVSDIFDEVAKNITETMKTNNVSTPLKELVNQSSNIEFFDDSFSQYRKEFDESCNRIKEFSSVANMSHEDRVSQLENICTDPATVMDIIQSFETHLKSNMSSANFAESESLLAQADALFNLTACGENITNILKKNLRKNAKKTPSPSKLVNTTVEEDDGFRNMGPFYGLPSKVKEILHQVRGIGKLYEWQDECLNMSAIQNRTNLVYALPTSGGKTLVAEIIILREILCRRKNVIFILPFVAIVQEKVWSLSPFAVALDFLVEEYSGAKGSYPPRKRRRKQSVYVATMEKALGLLNSLIETKRIDEIGLIVVDELHLVGDNKRGHVLESILTKVMYLGESIQIIGMSATIGNLKEICDFLKAEMYKRDFRPVELIEYVKCEKNICKIEPSASDDDMFKFQRIVDFPWYNRQMKLEDPDFIGGLVMEVIPQSSCLIFCRSKLNCENVAKLLTKTLKREVLSYKKEQKDSLLKAVENEVGSLCPVLNVTLKYGVAYHHSGLTAEERRLIEDAYREGIISVICCTSTLAAGVNLPAKRVIIRNPYIGKEFINISRYKQMIGRAGRAGMGELGESIVVVSPKELPQMRELLLAPMDIANSSMHLYDSSGLRNLILSSISLGMVTNRKEILALIDATLLGHQAKRLNVDMKHLTNSSIKALFKEGAIESNAEHFDGSDISFPSTISGMNSQGSVISTKITIKNNTPLTVSELGKAAIKGGFTMNNAKILYEDLQKGLSCLVLFTGLHLMYLVTPYETLDQVTNSKPHYYSLYLGLNQRELQTAHVLGLTESVASKMAVNRKITEVPERVLDRFYVTLMLYDLWNGKSVYEVSQKFNVNRGIVQTLMANAASFSSNVCNFCDVLKEFWTFAVLLKGMNEKLAYCCVKELLPLMQLPSVKENRAKQLFNAGFRTLQSIAKADPQDLVNTIEYMSRKLANQIIAAAKMILLERVENLRDEAEDVIEGVHF